MAGGQKFIPKQVAGMMLGVLAKGRYALAEDVVAYLNSPEVKKYLRIYKLV